MPRIALSQDSTATDSAKAPVSDSTARSAFPRDSVLPPVQIDSTGAARTQNHDASIARVSNASCSQSAGERRFRRAAVGAVFIGGNAALYEYFRRAWWSGEPSGRFFFRADWDEAFRDQDKFGHLYGGYHLARFGNALIRSACVSRSSAVAWSAAYATLFQLQIEIWDARYEKYGFSYPDLIANTAGMAYFVLQRTHPRLQAFKPTISYARTAAMRNADNIPGELRPSLDYSGQTYWISADVDALLPHTAKPYWPGFIRASIGHSITDWVHPRTGAVLRAERKILLTLDFDAEKLPGENRIWKTFKRQLSYIHLPSPALQLTPELDILKWYR